jgi:hypothetical protein
MFLGHGELWFVCFILLLTYLISIGGLVAGISSSYSAGEPAQTVFQSFYSVFFGSALLVGSSLVS